MPVLAAECSWASAAATARIRASEETQETAAIYKLLCASLRCSALCVQARKHAARGSAHRSDLRLGSSACSDLPLCSRSSLHSMQAQQICMLSGSIPLA